MDTNIDRTDTRTSFVSPPPKGYLSITCNLATCRYNPTLPKKPIHLTTKMKPWLSRTNSRKTLEAPLIPNPCTCKPCTLWITKLWFYFHINMFPKLFYLIPPSGITSIVHSLTGLQINLFQTCNPAFPSDRHTVQPGDPPPILSTRHRTKRIQEQQQVHKVNKFSQDIFCMSKHVFVC